MKASHWFTVVLGGFFTILPQLIPYLPAEARDIATAVIGMGTAIFHLYQPVPTSQEH